MLLYLSYRFLKGCIPCTNTCGPNTRRRQVGNFPLGCQPYCECEVCPACNCAPGQVPTYGADGCCNGCQGSTCQSNCNSPCPTGQIRIPVSGTSTCQQCECRCRTCPSCPAGQAPTGNLIPGSVCSDCTCRSSCPLCQPCPQGTIRSTAPGVNGCPNCECIRCPQPTCFCNIGQVPSLSNTGANGCPICTCVPCPRTGCPAVCPPGLFSQQSTSSNGCPTCQCVPCQTQGCPATCPPGSYSVRSVAPNGCPSCTCVSCQNLGVQCPARCEPGRTYSVQTTDQNGCTTCVCSPCNVCDQCPPGSRATGGVLSNGCPSCECTPVLPPQCNAFQCSCQVGQVAELAWINVNGAQCQSCNCVSNPCASQVSIYFPICHHFHIILFYLYYSNP